MRKLLATLPLVVLGPEGIAAEVGEVGDVMDVTAACLSAEPYQIFEEVYEADGNFAAYKALMASEKCATLPEAVEVRLEESVNSFDYGWGKGMIWRVTPVDPHAPAPEAFFIRLRE